jgi:DNA repair protein RecO (recombination protein O)
MLKGILKSRKGRLKVAFFQPLTQLEIVAKTNASGALGYIREAAISYSYTSLHTDIRKGAVALFLAEVLTQCIRQQETEPQLFQYVETTLQWLDQHEEMANFHIRFLMGLTRHLGFFPDQSSLEGSYFDLVEGSFCTDLSLNPCFGGPELAHFKTLLGMNFDDIHTVKLNQNQRKILLENMVRYFEIHLHGFKKPKSLVVLDEVFS